MRHCRRGRIFRRLENSLSINYGVIQLTKFVLWTVLIAHWMACAYHVVTVIEVCGGRRSPSFTASFTASFTPA